MIAAALNRAPHRTRIAFAVFAAVTLAYPAALRADDTDPVRLYYFWGDGCPICDRQAEFLDRLGEEYPELEIHRFEVWYDDENRQLLQDVAELRGFDVRGVPVTLVSDRYWVGFNAAVASQIRDTVERCEELDCPDPVSAALPPARLGGVEGAAIRLPFLGTIDAAGRAPLASTVLIAAVDGVNPCSLWVLTMLLALVAYARSRAKTVIVGSTFLLVTALVYGAFILGAVTVLGMVRHLGWVRAITAAVALIFGIVSVKEYFAFGRGVSFTISPGQKRTIAAWMRSAVAGERSLAAMVALTAIAAFGIALVELPCTAGFPVIWSGMIAERGISGAPFVALLAVYLLVYLLIEIAVFVTALVGARVFRMTETYARVIKLFGGVIMIALAVVLLLVPDALTAVDRSFAAFAAALGVGFVILLLHRRIVEARRGAD